MKENGLPQFTNKELYCQVGDFYVDPWQPVKREVITHAHGDHAHSRRHYRQGIRPPLCDRRSNGSSLIHTSDELTVDGYLGIIVKHS